MHKKTFLLLATIVLLLTILISTPVAFAKTQTSQNSSAPQLDSGDTIEPTPAPQPESAKFVTPPGGDPAFYIIGGTWDHRTGQQFHADGVYQFWTWATFNTAPGQYNFSRLDQWVAAKLAVGYTGIGVAINTYTGRLSSPCGVVDQGVDAIPEYVQKGRDGQMGTSDDAVLVADVADQRNYAGCTNYGGDWYVPDYNNDYYWEQYNKFIHALADHLLDASYRDNIGWISIGTGKDGENIPVDNTDDDFLLKHVSVADWVTYEKAVMDMYADAFYDGSGFPRLSLTVQNAPAYRKFWERRDIASYANQKRIGVSINGMTSDFVGSLLCDDPNPTTNCTGMYDQAVLYQNSIPIQLETYGYMTGTENEFYAAMARALHFHTDYIRLSGFWTYPGMDTQLNRDIAKWTTKYMGKGFLPGQDEPPSIWSRMREHRNPLFLNYAWTTSSSSWPVIGNYEFFLTQKDYSDFQAVTIPVTDDPRITWTGSNSTTAYQKRWHKNTDPYDPQMGRAGLYRLNRPDTGVQTQVDPGWVARRTDQATNQVRFIFDAADRYFDHTQADSFKAIVTVTYQDVGSDKWFLQYDSTTGPKIAVPYAINNWTPQLGLALDGGLPTSGVLNTTDHAVTKTDSGQWKVATFLIEDGSFNNGLFNGEADIAIDSRDPDTGALDGNEYIHHVDIQRVDAFAPPVKTGVKGFVYADMNENGVRDANEPGIHGATIKLQGATNYQTTATGSGYYEMSDVAPGQYTLSATAPAGYEQLEPASIAIFVSTNNMLRVDFKHPPVEIKRYLYLPLIQIP
jgi:hypothetical protein